MPSKMLAHVSPQQLRPNNCAGKRQVDTQADAAAFAVLSPKLMTVPERQKLPITMPSTSLCTIASSVSLHAAGLTKGAPLGVADACAS